MAAISNLNCNGAVFTVLRDHEESWSNGEESTDSWNSKHIVKFKIS